MCGIQGTHVFLFFSVCISLLFIPSMFLCVLCSISVFNSISVFLRLMICLFVFLLYLDTFNSRCVEFKKFYDSHSDTYIP